MATGNRTSGWSSTSRKRHHIEVNPPPTTMITDLEDDLLVEILIRLPNPRHSCRSKRVCKRWSSLISDPCFNRRFVSHHQCRNEALLFLPSHDPKSVIRSFFPVPPDEVPENFGILDSFKDLVLCGFKDSDTSGSDCWLGRSYMVCNPFTKQWIAIPLAPGKKQANTGSGIIASRLVCEPRSNFNLDLGDGKTFVYSTEFRFRVVSIWVFGASMRVDVFCSESGEWTKDAFVVQGVVFMVQHSSLCNGELFYAYYPRDRTRVLGALNPFFLDRPPRTYTDVSAMLAETWEVMVSQGALHVAELKPPETPAARVRSAVVWRLEEDRRSWRKQCEGLVKISSSMGDYYPLKMLRICALHPEKPEIVFLRYWDSHVESIFTCDLRSGGELEFVDQLNPHLRDWMVFQPKVSGWPTPIPRYKKFRGSDDGSHSSGVQSDSSTSM
ncbi:unnamed protein product [Linum trigynum]|uniref:F-box domain-containing protein n=1 Tax=Linum trigynum TaxID=586398 RepID=A0AAV2GGC9_9ROSI